MAQIVLHIPSDQEPIAEAPIADIYLEDFQDVSSDTVFDEVDYFI